MRKSVLITVSIILISIIIFETYALNKKPKNSSKIQEKNVSEILNAKSEDNQDKNEEERYRNSVDVIKVDMNIGALKLKDKKNKVEQQVAKQVVQKKAGPYQQVQQLTQQRINSVIKIASAKVIVVDPGHANSSNLVMEEQAPGGSIYKIKDGGGAKGVVTQTPEYLVNMLVSIKLKQDLERMGYKVVMTKTDNSVSLGNIYRANIGNDNHAVLVIRIHADSSENSSIKGSSILIPAPINENTKAIYSESKRDGQIVLDALTSQVGMPNRGIIVRDDITGFNWSKVPVILVEMGFLSNPDEDRFLSTNDYQTKLAMALANGIQIAIK